ncbi:MAG: signal peptidase II [Holosporaceae bacterium]|jgi:signal peptidase II|nr:signal peptidase II [Holosporaceae bacterium]
MPKSSKRIISKDPIICSIIAGLVFLGDQVTKFYVEQMVFFGEQIKILSFFNIIRIENRGVTFGILNGGEVPQWVFALLSATAIIALCVWAARNPSYRLSVSLIVSGAAGNLADRILRNGVVDFLDFHLLNYHWPAFNVADSAIVIGAMVLFFVSNEKKEKI